MAGQHVRPPVSCFRCRMAAYYHCNPALGTLVAPRFRPASFSPRSAVPPGPSLPRVSASAHPSAGPVAACHGPIHFVRRRPVARLDSARLLPRSPRRPSRSAPRRRPRRALCPAAGLALAWSACPPVRARASLFVPVAALSPAPPLWGTSLSSARLQTGQVVCPADPPPLHRDRGSASHLTDIALLCPLLAAAFSAMVALCVSQRCHGAGLPAAAPSRPRPVGLLRLAVFPARTVSSLSPPSRKELARPPSGVSRVLKPARVFCPLPSTSRCARRFRAIKPEHPVTHIDSFRLRVRLGHWQASSPLPPVSFQAGGLIRTGDTAHSLLPAPAHAPTADLASAKKRAPHIRESKEISIHLHCRQMMQPPRSNTTD